MPSAGTLGPRPTCSAGSISPPSSATRSGSLDLTENVYNPFGRVSAWTEAVSCCSAAPAQGALVSFIGGTLLGGTSRLMKPPNENNVYPKQPLSKTAEL